MHPEKQDPLCERDCRIIRQVRPRSCFGWVEAVQASNCKPNTGHSAASADAAAIEIGWLPRPAGHGRQQRQPLHFDRAMDIVSFQDDRITGLDPVSGEFAGCRNPPMLENDF